jgi:hypothetical protein
MFTCSYSHVHHSFANYVVISGLLLVLKDVNMINKGFKEGCFFLWNRHVLFLMYMFFRFSTTMVLFNCVVKLEENNRPLSCWCVTLSF